MRFNQKPPQKSLNPKDTLSNYVRESHRPHGVTLETATILTLMGMLGASGIWILSSQVSLEKRLTTLETQYQNSQESLSKIENKLIKLDDKLDAVLQRP